MTGLRITTFGELAIESDCGQLESLPSPRIQELFVFLLVHNNRSHSRDALASLFWNDASGVQSRKWLRQALWKLRVALESRPETSEALKVHVHDERVELCVREDVWLDIAEFERSFNRTRGIRGDSLDSELSACLESAVAIYRGAFLDGWYQDWCVFERERLENMLLMMLDKLTTCHEARGDYEAGIIQGRRILDIDRAHERAHRSLMRLHYLSGDRTQSLRQYERCTLALQEDLDVAPSQETRELYDQIRAGRLKDDRVMFDGPVHRTSKEPSEIRDALMRLSGIEQLLLELQEHVHERVQLIESRLTGD